MMRWIWLAISVLSSTAGDLVAAKGMTAHGEMADLGGGELARVLRHMGTNSLVLAGIFLNAVSFLSFIALLSVAELSVAVPATASSYILKTALAQWYLDEDVSKRRWAGAVLVALGIYLITI